MENYSNLAALHRFGCERDSCKAIVRRSSKTNLEWHQKYLSLTYLQLSSSLVNEATEEIAAPDAKIPYLVRLIEKVESSLNVLKSQVDFHLHKSTVVEKDCQNEM